MLTFVRLIFVAAIDYENIFTTKISRFTVCVSVYVSVCNSRMDCVVAITVALSPNPCSALAALTLTLWKNNSMYTVLYMHASIDSFEQDISSHRHRRYH